MPAALSGLRVVDLTRGLAGALTTMVLADHGAEVVKVEPPGGDPGRAHPAFAQWNRGKRSVVADLASGDGRRAARTLADAADVVVQSWRPGVAERLGVDHDSLAAGHPGLISCAITGFGPRGPFAALHGYEAAVAAKGGVMAFDDRPRYAPIAGASFAASHAALQGILAALYERASSGAGQQVQASLVQGLTAYDLPLAQLPGPLPLPRRHRGTDPLLPHPGHARVSAATGASCSWRTSARSSSTPSSGPSGCRSGTGRRRGGRSPPST